MCRLNWGKNRLMVRETETAEDRNRLRTHLPCLPELLHCGKCRFCVCQGDAGITFLNKDLTATNIWFSRGGWLNLGSRHKIYLNL